MAELEIGPAPRQFVGQTPSFPSTAPVQEQLQRSAQQVDETLRRASTLLLAINRQKQNQTDASAFIDLDKARVGLDEQARQITDPQQRMDFLTKGLNSAWDNIQKQYPRISPSARKQAELSLLNDHRQNFFGMVAEEHKQAVHDIAKKYDETKRLSALSTDHQQQIALKFNFFNYLDTARNNGIISTIEADDYKVKIQRDINLERLASLAASHPDQVLTMEPSEAVSKWGVLPTDLLKYQTQASQIIANGHDLALMQHKRQQNQNEIDAINMANSGNKAGVLQMEKEHKITTPFAEGLIGADIEKNPPNPALLSHLSNDIDHIRAKNVDDFDAQYLKLIEPYLSHLNMGDRYELQRMASDRRRDIGDTVKDNAVDLGDELSIHVSDIESDPTFSFAPTDITKPIRDKINKLLLQGKHRMKGAKDEAEQEGIAKQTTEAVDKIMDNYYNTYGGKRTKPASSATPKSAAPTDMRSEALPPDATATPSATPTSAPSATPTSAPAGSPTARPETEAGKKEKATIDAMIKYLREHGYPKATAEPLK